MAFSKAVWEVRIQHKPGIIFSPFEKGHIRMNEKHRRISLQACTPAFCPFSKRRDHWKNPPGFSCVVLCALDWGLSGTMYCPLWVAGTAETAAVAVCLSPF